MRLRFFGGGEERLPCAESFAPGRAMFSTDHRRTHRPSTIIIGSSYISQNSCQNFDALRAPPVFSSALWCSCSAISFLMGHRQKFLRALRPLGASRFSALLASRRSSVILQISSAITPNTPITAYCHVRCARAALRPLSFSSSEPPETPGLQGLPPPPPNPLLIWSARRKRSSSRRACVALPCGWSCRRRL